MKIYRVSYRDSSDEHKGYEYFSNKTDAVKADNKNRGNQMRDDVEEIEFQPTKSGVLRLLNIYASHPDNG
jgi:hypothetical protein